MSQTAFSRLDSSAESTMPLSMVAQNSSAESTMPLTMVPQTSSAESTMPLSMAPQNSLPSNLPEISICPTSDIDIDDQAETGRLTAYRKNAVVVLTLNGRLEIICSNPSVYAMLGYSPAQLVGTSLMQLVCSSDVQRTQAVLRELFERGIGTVFENKLRDRNGNVRDYSWSAYYAENDRTVICVGHDVTEKNKAANLKEEVITMVSHDLRSPLTSIRFSLALLELGANGVLPPDAMDDIDVAKRNADRLLKLVDELLDFKKTEQADLQIRPIEISELITDAIESVQNLSGPQMITLAADVVSDTVYVDPLRLGQVLVNILSNAIKFSPPRSTVKICARVREDQLVIEIVDEGPGVPPEFADIIFQRFGRINLPSHLEKGGTGLGLAICKNIVEKHGGTIAVSSHGSGSNFTVAIPVPLHVVPSTVPSVAPIQ